MKKEYTAPQVDVIKFEVESVLSLSNVIIDIETDVDQA